MAHQRRLPNQQAADSLARYQPVEAFEPPPQQADSSSNIALSIWRHRWAALLITLACLSIAFAYLRTATKYYPGFCQIYVKPDNGVPILPTMSEPGQYRPDTFLEYQCTLIKSAVILKPVAAQVYGADLSDEELGDDATNLQGFLTVEVGRKDDTLNIQFESPDPVQAARVANLIVDEYTRFETEIPIDSSKGASRILMADKRKYEAQLVQEQDAITEFRRKNPGIAAASSGGPNSTSAALLKYGDAMTTAHLALIDAEGNYNAAQAFRNNPEKLRELATTTTVGGNPQRLDAATQQLKSDLNAVELRIAMNEPRLGKNNPIVQGDEAQAAALRAKIAANDKEFTEKYLSSVEVALTQAREREAALKRSFQDAENDESGKEGLESQLSRLISGRDATDKLVSALDDRIKQLGIKQDYNIPTIDILQTARVNHRPSRPARLRILALTLAIGLLLGCGYGIVRDKLDGRVRSADEIAAFLGLPVVGAIPRMKRGLTALARSQAAHWDPMSDVAEAYRAVRTAVHFGVPAGQARTIVITSPTPGDGKSTLASNLAVTMAQAGKRTLLLDADFRRPVQQKMFEVKEQTGLTSVLAGNDSLASVIRRTVVEGLDVLPAGPTPLNPSELLHGESFAGIIEELSQSYDHIVLDCPPVMAVTDARILGAICDVSLLVLRAGHSTRRAAELARGSLLSVGARLLGVVVNDVVGGDEQYGYHGTYYSYQPFETGRRLPPPEEAENDLVPAPHSPNNGGSRKMRRLPSNAK